jgi:hypothetical protein
LLLDFLQERPSYRCPAVIFLRRGDELRDEVPWAERVRIFSDDCKVVYKAASPVEQTQHAVVRGIPELPEPNEHELSRAHRRISWFRRAIAGEDLDGGGGHA